MPDNTGGFSSLEPLHYSPFLGDGNLAILIARLFNRYAIDSVPVLCFPRGCVIREVVRLKEAEEDGDDTEDASGAGDLERGSGTVRVATVAAGAARSAAVAGGRGTRLLGALALRVLLLATAGELTLDDGVALVLLESGAHIVEVLVGLEVEGTTDVLELGEVGTAVNVSTNSCLLIFKSW